MDDDVEKSDEELYMKNGAVYSAKRILDAVSIGDLVFTTDGSANVVVGNAIDSTLEGPVFTIGCRGEEFAGEEWFSMTRSSIAKVGSTSVISPFSFISS